MRPPGRARSANSARCSSFAKKGERCARFTVIERARIRSLGGYHTALWLPVFLWAKFVPRRISLNSRHLSFGGIQSRLVSSRRISYFSSSSTSSLNIIPQRGRLSFLLLLCERADQLWLGRNETSPRESERATQSSGSYEERRVSLSLYISQRLNCISLAFVLLQ